MKIFTSKNILAIGALCVSASALAIDPGQLQGEVMSVDEDAGSITVRLTEVGEGLDAQVDSVHTYTINDDTEIEDDFETEVLDDELGDIQPNETVTIQFDTDNNTMARSIRRHQPDDL